MTRIHFINQACQSEFMINQETHVQLLGRFTSDIKMSTRKDESTPYGTCKAYKSVNHRKK